MKEILGLADESNLKLNFDSNFDDEHIPHSHSNSLKRPLNDPYIPHGSPSPRRQSSSSAHSPRRSSFTSSNNASIRAGSVNFRDSSPRDRSVGRASTKATMNASQLVYNAHFSGLEVSSQNSLTSVRALLTLLHVLSGDWRLWNDNYGGVDRCRFPGVREQPHGGAEEPLSRCSGTDRHGQDLHRVRCAHGQRYIA